MAVLCNNFDAPMGGTESRARALVRRFIELGRAVVVVTTIRTSVAAYRVGSLPLFERRGSLRIYRVPYFVAGWRERTQTDLFDRLAVRILRRHPRLSVICAFSAPFGGAHGARIGRILGLPVLATLECDGPMGDLQTVRGDPPRLELLRSVDRIAYSSDGTRDEAVAAGIDPARLVFLPHAFDPDRLRGNGRARVPELQPESSRELLLFVGRLTLDRQKRVDVLLEAFARLVTRRPNARLAIAGDGDGRESLTALARRLGLLGNAPRVAFLGVRSDVGDLLRAATAFVLPSAHESFAVVLSEAMAAGRPIVATDVPGIRCAVRHDQEGILVPLDDPEALAGALERVVSDEALARRLGEAGRRRAVDLSVDVVAPQKLAVLDSLPRRSRRRAREVRRAAGREGLPGVVPILWGEILHFFGPIVRREITRRVQAVKAMLGVRADLLRR